VSQLKPTYLVTGGTGFLGRHVVSALRQKNLDVLVLAQSLPQEEERIPGAKYIAASVLDHTQLAEAVKHVELQGIFHLAGIVWHSKIINPPSFREINVEGLLNIIQLAANMQQLQKSKIRIVYASSSGVSACSEKPEDIFDESYPYSLVSSKYPYYLSKIDAEIEGRNLAKKLDVELVCMRPSLILGPGDTHQSSTRIIRDFLEKRIPICPSGGISFVDVRDAATAFVAAMELKQGPSYAYFLSSVNCSIFDLFVVLEQMSGVPRPFFTAPTFLSVLFAHILTFMMGLFFLYDPKIDPVWASMGNCFWSCDCALAKKELGFTPRKSFDTLRETIKWIEDNDNFDEKKIPRRNTAIRFSFKQGIKSWIISCLLICLLSTLVIGGVKAMDFVTMKYFSDI